MRREPAPAASAQSVELLRSCAATIAPDSPDGHWYAQYSAVQAERLALDLELVRRLVKPGARVVEVGAVPLLLTLALVREGLEVHAVDIDPSRFSRAIAEHGLDVARCDIETEPLPLPDSSADVLLFNELLEHLRINPVHALQEVRRVLVPGGLLLLSTPNLRSLNGLRNLLVHSRSYALKGDVYEEFANLEQVGHMGHVREYAPGDVRLLLERVGFEVEMLVFRGRQSSPWAELICRLAPQLRHSVSYVARRTASS